MIFSASTTCSTSVPAIAPRSAPSVPNLASCAPASPSRRRWPRLQRWRTKVPGATSVSPPKSPLLRQHRGIMANPPCPGRRSNAPPARGSLQSSIPVVALPFAASRWLTGAEWARNVRRHYVCRRRHGYAGWSRTALGAPPPTCSPTIHRVILDYNCSNFYALTVGILLLPISIGTPICHADFSSVATRKLFFLSSVPALLGRYARRRRRAAPRDRGDDRDHDRSQLRRGARRQECDLRTPPASMAKMATRSPSI